MNSYVFTLIDYDYAVYGFLAIAAFAATVLLLRWAFGINRLLKRVKANNELLAVLAKRAGADPAELEKIINHAEGNV